MNIPRSLRREGSRNRCQVALFNAIDHSDFPGRKERVVIDGTASNLAPVTLEEFHGSFLGFGLFIFYKRSSGIVSAYYTDDSKRCSSVSSHDD